MTTNPLSKYTDKPGMFVHLPSKGRFYKTPPKLTVDGDIEVHPLTAIDELYLKNPDGLYNNESLYKVFKSTIPSIANPEDIPTPDLDALFIALRITTYGEQMDVSAKCAKCDHHDEYNVDLVPLLQQAKEIPETDTVEIDSLVLHLRPYTVASNARIAEYAMGVARAAQKAQEGMLNDNKDDTSRRELSDAIAESSEALIGITSTSITKIIIPETGDTSSSIVTDPKFIDEYVRKLTAPQYAKLRNVLIELSHEVIDRKFKFNCQKCEHENSGEVSFDPAHFFG